MNAKPTPLSCLSAHVRYTAYCVLRGTGIDDNSGSSSGGGGVLPPELVDLVLSYHYVPHWNRHGMVGDLHSATGTKPGESGTGGGCTFNDWCYDLYSLVKPLPGFIVKPNSSLGTAPFAMGFNPNVWTNPLERGPILPPPPPSAAATGGKRSSKSGAAKRAKRKAGGGGAGTGAGAGGSGGGGGGDTSPCIISSEQFIESEWSLRWNQLGWTESTFTLDANILLWGAAAQIRADQHWTEKYSNPPLPLAGHAGDGFTATALTRELMRGLIYEFPKTQIERWVTIRTRARKRWDLYLLYHDPSCSPPPTPPAAATSDAPVLTARAPQPQLSFQFASKCD